MAAPKKTSKNAIVQGGFGVPAIGYRDIKGERPLASALTEEEQAVTIEVINVPQDGKEELYFATQSQYGKLDTKQIGRILYGLTVEYASAKVKRVPGARPGEANERLNAIVKEIMESFLQEMDDLGIER